MASQGHCPSAAAFRALLDVQLARGGWEEADGLLASMVEQHSEGLDVEVRAGGQLEGCPHAIPFGRAGGQLEGCPHAIPFTPGQG